MRISRIAAVCAVALSAAACDGAADEPEANTRAVGSDTAPATIETLPLVDDADTTTEPTTEPTTVTTVPTTAETATEGEPDTDDVAQDEPPDSDSPTSGDFPETVEEWLPFLGEELIAGLGGIECATEIAAILVAAVEYNGITGPDPESMAVIEPYLDRPIELWTLEPGDETPQPVPGSGCSTDGFDIEPTGADASTTTGTLEQECAVRQLTLETVIEAYDAENGELPTAADQLEQYVADPSVLDEFELGEGGSIRPKPGTPCAEFGP